MSIRLLVVRELLRTPIRTALVILGLSVTGALLLDMTMLSHGLEASLGTVLSRLGFAVRVVPKGTLPFATSAEIPDGDRLAAAIGQQPGVASVVPVVATNLYVRRSRERFPAFAIGVPSGGSGFYAVQDGRDIRPAPREPRQPGDAGPRRATPPAVVIDRNMARFHHIRLGETLVLSAVPQPFVAPYAAPRPVRVAGIADFYFDLPNQVSVALATGTLREIEGTRGGAVSLILVRLTDPARAEELARWIAARDPQVDALSIRGFLRRASSQLTYFTQFSLILGTISVVVSFLLITAIVTLSLGERLGEIAILRALGFTRLRIGAVILLEGLLLSMAALPGAFAFGLLISQNLDAILRAAPSVPQGLHFFTLTAQAAARTVALLLVTGALGGLYPAAVASRLGVAATLHAEVAS